MKIKNRNKRMEKIEEKMNVEKLGKNSEKGQEKKKEQINKKDKGE